MSTCYLTLVFIVQDSCKLDGSEFTAVSSQRHYWLRSVPVSRSDSRIVSGYRYSDPVGLSTNLGWHEFTKIERLSTILNLYRGLKLSCKVTFLGDSNKNQVS
jgi:hypothetical protein